MYQSKYKRWWNSRFANISTTYSIVLYFQLLTIWSQHKYFIPEIIEVISSVCMVEYSICRRAEDMLNVDRVDIAPLVRGRRETTWFYIVIFTKKLHSHLWHVRLYIEQHWVQNSSYSHFTRCCLPKNQKKLFCGMVLVNNCQVGNCMIMTRKFETCIPLLEIYLPSL